MNEPKYAVFTIVQDGHGPWLGRLYATNINWQELPTIMQDAFKYSKRIEVVEND